MGSCVNSTVMGSGLLATLSNPFDADRVSLLDSLNPPKPNSRFPMKRLAMSRTSFPAFRDRGIRLACRIEGGEIWSTSFRVLMRHYHGVHIGRYSYGSSLWSGVFPAGTRIGRYCSLAGGIQVFRRNHPTARMAMHPFFYNAHCGLVAEDTIPAITENPLEIAHDAWVGANAIITPRCRRIGIGAVVGAGAVVTADVPDFSIVAGNPARLARKRFSDETSMVLLDSRWWEYSIRDLVPVFPLFLADATPESVVQVREHLQSCQPVEDFPD